MSYESELFEAADQLRGSVESAEYKHLVLGLIFLKYISDSFERRRKALEEETHKADSPLHTDSEDERQEILEDRDEYIGEYVFWVPEEARWEKVLAAASTPEIGRKLDDALEAIESDNREQLRGVLPRIYARAHCLRRSWASWSRRSGVSASAVSALCLSPAHSGIAVLRD